MPGYWHQIIRESVEMFFDLLDSTENFVHDTMIPEILEATDAPDRDAFYAALDMDHVRQVSPKIWARVSKDALDIQERNQNRQIDFIKALQQQQAAASAGPGALAGLDKTEAKQDSAFKYQEAERPVLGLRIAGVNRANTLSTGIDATPGVTALPMG